MVGKRKKALGVRLGRPGQRGELGEAGVGEGERQLALGDLVQGGDQRLELGLVEELDLVEEEDDAGLVLLGCLAEGEEEVGEVV